MVKQALSDKLANFVDSYNNAFLVGYFGKKELIYCNKVAFKLFGVNMDTQDLDALFVHTGANLMDMVVSDLQSTDLAVHNDLPLVTVTGKIQLCDVQYGFFDEEKTEIFVELTPKEDNRMINALQQVHLSSRAEAILEFDDKLTLILGNAHFMKVFEADEQICQEHYDNYFSNGFQPEMREILLKEIHENLEKSGHFITNMKVITAKGEDVWYSLELQRRTLDHSGVDKVMVHLLNIENYVHIESEYKNTNQYFSAIQELSDDLLYRIDIKNKRLLRREKSKEQVNLLGVNVVAENFPESVCEQGFVHPDDVGSYLEFGYRALEGIAGTVEVRMKSVSGEFGFRRIICVPVMNEDGSVKEMLGKVVNIQGVRELEQMAEFDDLTNILNKRAMLERTTQCLERSNGTESHALFFLDLDDFKCVNDTHGHAFGDYLLRELGKRLNENTRSRDFVGRVGGDEFVVFLRDVPSEDVLLGKAKMLLAAISEDVVEGEKRHTIHGSIGIAVYPEHGTSYEELYHHADLSLYQSKHKGKNIATLYSDKLKKD